MPIYKQPWLWIIVISVLISGTILYFQDEISSMIVEENVAIIVNDQKMTEEEFNMVYNQLKKSYEMMLSMGGEEASEEDLLEMAIEASIEQLLIKSYAKKNGIKVTSTDKEDLYEDLIAHDPSISTKEELFSGWEEEGFTEKEMREQIDVYLLHEKIIEKYSKDIEVTEEDLKEAYEEYVSVLKEMEIPDEEIEALPEIREDLIHRKEQELAYKKLEDAMDKFREESNIEVLLELN